MNRTTGVAAFNFLSNNLAAYGLLNLLLLTADKDTGEVRGSKRWLAAQLNINRGTLDHHLKVLARTGAIEEFDDGRYTEGYGIRVLWFSEMQGLEPVSGSSSGIGSGLPSGTPIGSETAPLLPVPPAKTRPLELQDLQELQNRQEEGLSTVSNNGKPQNERRDPPPRYVQVAALQQWAAKEKERDEETTA